MTRWLGAGPKWFRLMVLLLLPASAPAAEPEGKMKTFWVYFGTYTGKKSKGIYRSEFDPASGHLSAPVLAGEATNPSFLAIHPDGRHLYAVGEIGDFGGKKTGGVSAFAIDPKTGDLKLLNQQSSGGGGPCHVVIDKAGKNVLVANYGGGSCAALPVGADGKLSPAASVCQHVGNSVNPQRQQAPHAHSINLDPANRFAFVADLGLDQVLVYRLDGATGKLAANDPPHAAVEPGAGPRHFAFHPSGRHAYVINELANTVIVFDYDAEKGVLTKKQTVTTLPEGFKGTSYTAEVVVHPSGKFVYGSNRGHNSIAAFATADDGTLKPVGHQAQGIKTPRNFNVDPTGRFVLVANQDGDRVLAFRVNQQTGALEPTEHKAEVPAPVCVRFLMKP